MAKWIRGLSDDEQQIFDRLTWQVRDKNARNRVRQSYMNAKHFTNQLPPTAPPYVRNISMVLGWPAKAVEALHRRTRFQGFYSPDSALDRYGLSEILDANNYTVEAGLGELDAMVQSCSFEIVTPGRDGEPAAVITHQSALSGTGDWNDRTRRLDSFLSISRWKEGEPVDFALYLPGEVIEVSDFEVANRYLHKEHVPVEVVAYKPRLGRPFGSSRISRPIMALTDSAVRTILRSEGTADLYGTPSFMLFGPDETAFDKDSWQLIMDRVNVIPDNDMMEGDRGRASVQQFTQGSQQPHVDQLQVWAGLFAGEANIPVSSLGVGMSQANPTSAEAYVASREDLISEAEAAADIWKPSRVRTALRAWRIANKTDTVPDDLKKLRARYRDARFTSKSAAADAAVKLTSAIPFLQDSETFLGTIFEDESLEGILNDKRRQQGSAIARLIGDRNGLD